MFGMKQVLFDKSEAYYFKGAFSMVGRNDTELGGSSPHKGPPVAFTVPGAED